MSEVSNIIAAVEKRDYCLNPDGSLKLDSLGRRIHINQKNNSNGRPLGRLYTTSKNIRISPDMRKAIEAAAKRDKVTVGTKIREYIEWGLENEEG